LLDYCTGLLMPCERKSVEPIASMVSPARAAAAHQSLAGDPLVEAQREAEFGLAFAHKMQLGHVTDIIASSLALVRMLRGLAGCRPSRSTASASAI
jgi:hypothetical protein